MELLLKNRRTTRADESVYSSLMSELRNADDIAKSERVFNKLYDQLVGPLWKSLSNKYMPPLSGEDMKDVFQEGWIKILENRRSYEEGKNVYNWVFTVLKNQIIDKIRSIDRKREDSLDDKIGEDEDTSRLDFLSNNEVSIEESLVERETGLLIRSAIEAIPDETDKIIIKKRIIYGMKYEYIAEDLDMPVATIHFRVNKALKILRPKIEKILNG